MKTQEFVALFRSEKDSMLRGYFESTDTSVAKRIAELNLSSAQLENMKAILDDALTDSFYTILLGLDGSASIGGVQRGYVILDEDRNEISDWKNGELEAHAYEQFQSNRNPNQ